jgi:hypothetical protein
MVGVERCAECVHGTWGPTICSIQDDDFGSVNRSLNEAITPAHRILKACVADPERPHWLTVCLKRGGVETDLRAPIAQ